GNLILSKRHFEKGGPDTFAREPIGTGPYRLVRRVKDQEVVLEAFKDYWGGERQIKRLVFKTIPDIATRVAAIQTGAVDIIGEGGIPPAFIAQLEPDPHVRPPYAAMAKKLLAEAGYPSGVEVVFNSSGGRYANEREVVEALAAQMQAVGINAKVNYMEWGAYMAKRRDAMTGHDMLMLGWSTG